MVLTILAIHAVNTVSPIANYCITVNQGGKLGHVAGVRGSINQVVLGAPCNDHVTPATIVITTAEITNTALNCPTGFIAVPGNSLFDQKSFCVMKYEAKNNGSGLAISTAAGVPWVNITQAVSVFRARDSCAGCELITDNQWLTIAHNTINLPSNWTSGAVGVGSIFRGHSDTFPLSNLEAVVDDSDGYSGTGQSSGDQRRTLSEQWPGYLGFIWKCI